MSPTIVELAAEISKHAAILNDYIATNNLSQPSFDKDGPLNSPIPKSESSIEQSRVALIEASKAIHDLALGPTEGLISTAITAKYDTAALSVINHFSIPKAVPVDGEASFAEIAASTGLSEDFVTRIIRYAMTSRIFEEPRPGYVAHTAYSCALLENKLFRGMISHHANEVFECTVKFIKAVDKYGDSGEPNETPFNIAFETDQILWSFYERPENEWRKQKFHDAMAFLTQQAELASGGNSADTLLEGGVDWEALGDGLVVDVGGSWGSLSQMIAQKHKKLRFIVQDLESVVIDGPSKLDPEVGGRIEFMAHNFFEPQPVAADVYLFRRIFHDYSDKYCVRILNNLIPKMTKTSKIVIADAILPPPNTLPKVIEKKQRAIDMTMWVMIGGKERAVKDWEKLIEQTDGKLKLLGITTPVGGGLGVIQI
ncbi:S-adenosyl-L-methionine-dependent methyltransferase, partial [Wilcoxina mikolae CBS 423.85]